MTSPLRILTEPTSRIIYIITFFTLCTASVKAQGGYEKNTVLDSMMVAGIWRTFEYHVPLYPAENPRLIVVLHGGAMTTKFMQKVTDYEFNRLADKNASSIIVYPEAHKSFWNHSRRETAVEKNEKKSLNDVLFIKSIVQRMERRYGIDRKNVFAIGYFDGGQMCYKLAKSIPNSFKGFAVVGANLPVKADDPLTSGDNPISLLLINDITDVTNPYDGGKVTPADGSADIEVMSTDETLRYWLKLFGGTEKILWPSPANIIEKDNSMAFRHDYFSKEKGKRISLLKIVRGGYPFPNPYFKEWPQMKENSNRHINIPETIVRFFYQLQYSK